MELIDVISEHPNIVQVTALCGVLSRMGDILMSRFQPGDPMIAEFEVLAEKFLSITSVHFSGTETCTCHILDDEGKLLRPVGTSGNLEPVSEFPVVRFQYGYYQHTTVRHMVGLMKKYGDLLKFSSWVIEAANKHWKRILTEHTSCGGGRSRVNENGVRVWNPKNHMAHQVMTWYLRMVDPQMAQLSKREARDRAIQKCSKCREQRLSVHSKICRGAVVV